MAQNTTFRDPANAARRFIPFLGGERALPDALPRYKVVDFRDESEELLGEDTDYIIQSTRERFLGPHTDMLPKNHESKPPQISAPRDNSRPVASATPEWQPANQQSIRIMP